MKKTIRSLLFKRTVGFFHLWVGSFGGLDTRSNYAQIKCSDGLI